LQFEKGRADKAEKCLDYAYNAAQEAGKIVDILYREIAILKGDQYIVHNLTLITADLMY